MLAAGFSHKTLSNLGLNHPSSEAAPLCQSGILVNQDPFLSQCGYNFTYSAIAGIALKVRRFVGLKAQVAWDLIRRARTD